MFQGTRRWIRREGASPKEEADERYPLDRPHRPSGRQLDGLPSGGARRSMGAPANTDHSGLRKNEKRLISLGSRSRIPGIETAQSPCLPPPRFALLPRRGKKGAHLPPPLGADDREAVRWGQRRLPVSPVPNHLPFHGIGISPESSPPPWGRGIGERRWGGFRRRIRSTRPLSPPDLPEVGARLTSLGGCSVQG